MHNILRSLTHQSNSKTVPRRCKSFVEITQRVAPVISPRPVKLPIVSNGIFVGSDILRPRVYSARYSPICLRNEVCGASLIGLRRLVGKVFRKTPSPGTGNKDRSYVTESNNADGATGTGFRSHSSGKAGCLYTSPPRQRRFVAGHPGSLTDPNRNFGFVA